MFDMMSPTIFSDMNKQTNKQSLSNMFFGRTPLDLCRLISQKKNEQNLIFLPAIVNIFLW